MIARVFVKKKMSKLKCRKRTCHCKRSLRMRMKYQANLQVRVSWLRTGAQILNLATKNVTRYITELF
jgi:hypothetical protein